MVVADLVADAAGAESAVHPEVRAVVVMVVVAVEEVTAVQKVAAGMEQVEGAGMVPVPETMAVGALVMGLMVVKAAKAEVRTAAADQVAAEVGNAALAE